MSEPKHSPLPWGWNEGDSGSADYEPEPACVGPEDDDSIVCYLDIDNHAKEVWHANAEFICLAVNNHAKLVAALELCAAVCAGETMHKNGLIEALSAAREVLASVKQQA